MKVLNIYDPQNTWTRRVGPWGTGWKGFFKADGNEFELQAKIAKKYYIKELARVRMVRIVGNDAMHKRWNLSDKLEELADDSQIYDRINFFCHGSPKHLNRKMISMINIEKFCKRLKAIATDDCKIVFYSCKTGKLDNGFASKVARLTVLETMGNTKSGHTTKLWAKRLFSPMHLSFSIAVKRIRLWSLFGGARALKKRLWASKNAPFEFVEEVFSGKE